MAFEFKLPDLGEGVSEGEIVRWLVAEGDVIRPEQEVVEVMTDKVTAALPCPSGGRVRRLHGAPGEVIHVGQPLLTVDPDGAGTPEGAAPEPEAARAGVEEARTVVELPRDPLQPPPCAENGATPDESGHRPVAVPAVRKLARDLGVDLAVVTGSGPGGRIVEQDVRAAAGGPGPRGEVRAAPAPPAVASASPTAATRPDPWKQPAPTATAPAAPPPAVPRSPAPLGLEVEGGSEGGVQRVPLRGVRRAIAEHLSDAHRNTAPYTFVEECDFTELVGVRERVQPLAQRMGVRLTYLPFIIAAVCLALKEHPYLNATVDGSAGDLLLHSEQHLSMATHTEAGLVVPVIRHADRRNILDLAREVERLSKGAREGRLAREDLVGGTFTISSLGAVGGVLGTPMLNTPQIAVLGVHKIAPRPAVRDGHVVVRQIGNLSLTLDHRYIDGYIGARFTETLVGYLQDPALMLFWLAEVREGPREGS